jgi:hypothetical protein
MLAIFCVGRRVLRSTEWSRPTWDSLSRDVTAHLKCECHTRVGATIALIRATFSPATVLPFSMGIVLATEKPFASCLFQRPEKSRFYTHVRHARVYECPNDPKHSRCRCYRSKVHIYLYLYLSISIYLSIYLFIYLFIDRSIYRWTMCDGNCLYRVTGLFHVYLESSHVSNGNTDSQISSRYRYLDQRESVQDDRCLISTSDRHMIYNIYIDR